MKASELTGAALDWAVATALGRVPRYDMESHGKTWWGWWLSGAGHDYQEMPSYSTNWGYGGPIIEREKIDCIAEPNGKDVWMGQLYTSRLQGQRVVRAYGPTPLVAAMRCYVASKLGSEVEIPEELK